MRNFDLKSGMASGVALAAAIFLSTGPASAQNAPSTLRLMTGPQGGVWVPLGGTLKVLWEKAVPGATVQTLPGAGIANVKAVEGGKSEIGFANSVSTVDAVEGRAPFEDKSKNVCNLGTLYPQYFQVVVSASSGINSVSDLKGKAIAVQPRGNTAEDITRHLLQVYGLDYNAMGKVSFVSYTDAVSLMQDGHAHAFTLGTTIPASSVMDLASSRDIKLLDLGDKIGPMKKINPGYTLVTIKANTYPKQSSDVKVIGYATHLIASCKLPEQTVYSMTKALVGAIPDMVAVNKAIDGLTPKVMAEDIGVPLHPGASRYYKEIGAL